MPRESDRLRPRPQPAVTSSKWWPWPAILGLAAMAAGFAALMIRLEVTQEGLQLSGLQQEQRDLQESNRRLRIAVAKLNSRKRLQTIAGEDGLAPPAAGHVVMMP